jgi:hypothetical protein
VVAVNPLPEAGLFNFKDPQTVSGVVGKGTVGGDLALFQALGHLLLAEEERNPGTVVNRSFIDAQTDGFAAYREARRDVDWAETGKAMVNVLLLQGNFGKPGAGACPVRGHSNVHGDRTMAIWENPKEWLLDALDAEFGIESPRHHGYDAVEAMEAFERDGVDVFMSMGGNFSLACSDTETLETGMQRIGLTVHVSTKPNRSHIIARMADATFGQGHAVDWKAMAADYDVVRDHISGGPSRLRGLQHPGPDKERLCAVQPAARHPFLQDGHWPGPLYGQPAGVPQPAGQPSGGLRYRQGLRCRVLPRGQRPGPQGERGARIQHSGVQGLVRPVRPTRQ